MLPLYTQDIFIIKPSIHSGCTSVSMKCWIRSEILSAKQNEHPHAPIKNMWQPRTYEQSSVIKHLLCSDVGSRPRQVGCSILLSEPSPPCLCMCVWTRWKCVCFLWWRGGAWWTNSPFESVVGEPILTRVLCNMLQVKWSTVVKAQRANDTPYHLDESASVCHSPTNHTRSEEEQLCSFHIRRSFPIFPEHKDSIV